MWRLPAQPEAPALGLYGGAEAGLPLDSLAKMQEALKQAAAGGHSRRVARLLDLKKSANKQPSQDGFFYAPCECTARGQLWFYWQS
jgi:hypothetical protein